MFGADLWANDWDHMTPKQELRLLIVRLKAARKGIILLHDSAAQDGGDAAGVLAIPP